METIKIYRTCESHNIEWMSKKLFGVIAHKETLSQEEAIIIREFLLSLREVEPIMKDVETRWE